MIRESKPKAREQVASLKRKEARLPNIPTAEYQSVMRKEAKAPANGAYPRDMHALEPEAPKHFAGVSKMLATHGPAPP